ncbi:hypothetical protein AX15_003485 [Amanita polypyramis BW_CC]|nr:hypothetical protein AX15_003485 [Amanita polypyramis BW_CC]
MAVMLEPPAPAAQSLNLLSLTTEVLLLVLDKCLTVDLLSISQTSRQLHYVAIPLYLSRFSIRNGLSAKEIHLEGRYMHALLGLQSSLIVPSLDRLSVKFNDGIYFAQEVRRLLSFIRRSGRIREVTLHFGNIDSRWVNGLIAVSSVTWRSDLTKLLSMLVECKCEVLNLRQGYFLTYETLITTEQDPVVLPKRRAFLGGRIPAMSSLFSASSTMTAKQAVRHQHPVLVELQDRSLRTFRLHSNLFFTHSFYSWMMDMFRKTPIRSLSLQASGVMDEEWTSFLQSLTVPTLTHVAFISSYIPFPDLLLFISRHPQLTNVDLHPHFRYPPDKKLSKKWKLSLPSLTSVGGNPENVRLFLNRLQPIPTLKHFSLSLPVHQRPFGLCDFEMVDKMIMSGTKNYRPRILTLEFLVPVICDDLPNYTNDDSGANLTRTYTRSVGLFPTVEIIRFSSDGCFTFSKWTLPLLPQWLASFPALKRVSLATNCLPQGGAERKTTMKAIKESCPNVKDVVLDDNEYVRRVAYWL